MAGLRGWPRQLTYRLCLSILRRLKVRLQRHTCASGAGPSSQEFGRIMDMFAVIRTGGKQYRVAPQRHHRGREACRPARRYHRARRSSSARRGQRSPDGQPDHQRGAGRRRGHRAEAGRQDHRLQEKAAPTYRRKNGHRQELTALRITEILTDGKKPAKAAPKPRGEEGRAGSQGEAEAKLRPRRLKPNQRPRSRRPGPRRRRLPPGSLRPSRRRRKEQSHGT